ncbi:hypothetical protein [uncultured Roseobacter sp.]|uniref:hypothetical protein n=1 Tax=uncultured Roseobacter sp. TaxID=114847 RepID=UPI00262B7900|nr:hypothetical protein [uncultured Roseobacter sp.]
MTIELIAPLAAVVICAAMLRFTYRVWRAKGVDKPATSGGQPVGDIIMSDGTSRRAYVEQSGSSLRVIFRDHRDQTEVFADMAPDTAMLLGKALVAVQNRLTKQPTSYTDQDPKTHADCISQEKELD